MESTNYGMRIELPVSYEEAIEQTTAALKTEGFGVLTSASLVGMASSPFIAGVMGGSSIRAVFLLNCAVMATLATVVYRKMVE